MFGKTGAYPRAGNRIAVPSFLQARRHIATDGKRKKTRGLRGHREEKKEESPGVDFGRALCYHPTEIPAVPNLSGFCFFGALPGV